MIASCPICGGRRCTVAAPYRYHHQVFSGMTRASCPGCGMVFATRAPDAAALEAYNASYFDSAHGGAATDPVTVAFHSGVNRLRVAHAERFVERAGITGRSVLEIGPGGGYFARHWLLRHPGSAYYAVETDRTCHPALRALGVKLLEAQNGSSPHVDMVVLSHVLEHVADPAAFLKATTASLRPGGALFIEVPCRDWEHKTLDEPHLQFFDKAPMLRLLEGLGFRGVQLTYHGRQISDLRQPGLRWRIANAIRTRLMARGFVAPFARVVPGLEPVSDPLDRAAVRPFEAHIEQQQPSWWLRAMAIKS